MHLAYLVVNFEPLSRLNLQQWRYIIFFLLIRLFLWRLQLCLPTLHGPTLFKSEPNYYVIANTLMYAFHGPKDATNLRLQRFGSNKLKDAENIFVF